MKVLIVDHSPIIQERLKAMLSEVPQVKTIGQAKDQFEAKKFLRELNPEGVVLDILMPGGI